ncbi:MAG: DUF4870 domain-containing protein [Phycisphaerae bacterium]|nr:DUF4870 domain-containing protein [Phycisphaerae bacterium]
MTQVDPNQTPPPSGQTGGGLTVQNWTVIAHLSALAGVIVPGVGCILGPLLVWLLKGKDDPRIEAHAKAALNFQISMLILMAICFVLVFVVIGMFLLPLVGLIDLILVIIATVKASNGELFKYPLSLKLIK